MKLVSEAGVGTIAAGVAKAGAQVIPISGHDGGTGAAPRTSIHNAGLPWELGLAEAHQNLIQNGLRSHVVLETDGKLMSGRDVAIACMLGAEEFGFATAPLVTLGCVMMRVCNLDTCPVGVATQNPELRKRFTGKPEYVVNFMRFVARELREHMARLGVRTVDQLVGRTDLLRVRKPAVNQRAATVDLSAILDSAYAGWPKTRFDPADAYDFHLEDTVDLRVLEQKLGVALEKGDHRRLELAVSSTDRAVGTILGSDITLLHGEALPDDTFVVKVYRRGRPVLRRLPAPAASPWSWRGRQRLPGQGPLRREDHRLSAQGQPLDPAENILVGNVALYGATSGQAFLNGVTGERFCVRNSGADAVVEGVGDHGCEYMTGGRVVILGPTGRNFAAGMSGGIAYVLDEDHDLYLRLNKELVSMGPVTEEGDMEALRGRSRLTQRPPAPPKPDEFWPISEPGCLNSRRFCPTTTTGCCVPSPGTRPRVWAGSRQRRRRSMSTPEERGTDRGKAHWISGYARQGNPCQPPLERVAYWERIPSPAGPGGAATAGGPVHGLRRALLSVRGGVERYGLRLPTAQSGARVERPGVPQKAWPRFGAATENQRLSRVHRPGVPRLV